MTYSKTETLEILIAFVVAGMMLSLGAMVWILSHNQRDVLITVVLVFMIFIMLYGIFMRKNK